VLYRPEGFEPLAHVPWDEWRVREEIHDIVADADGAYRRGELWPADEWDGWESPLPLKTLYVGAAGVAWALHLLRVRGFAETTLDLAGVTRQALGAWREQPGVLTVLDLPRPANASLFMGESGILAVLSRLAPDDRLADDLHALVQENAENPAADVLWGSPGTMLAARAMLEWTGDPRWAETWRSSAATLLASRDEDGLWTHELHGESYRGLGVPHGVTGNVLALTQGDLLPAEVQSALVHETAALLARTAVLEDGLASWPGAADEGIVAGDVQIRLQWDCGAPGIVSCAAAYLDEELLLAGAELTWRAGAHEAEKGAGICHGTAGNGYALLAAFERTQDARWLERARRFAGHALAQARRDRERRGRGRYSLWTGDIGVALFAADCIDGRSRYPVFGGWD